MNLNIVFETGIEYQASPLYALQSGNMGTFQYLCQCYQAGCEAENPSGHTAQHLLKTILAHSVEATQVFADAHTVAQLNAMLPAAFLHMGICPSTQAFRQAIVRKSERSKVSVPTLYIDGAVKQGGFQAQCLPSCFDDLDSFNTYLGHCRASTDAALLTGVKQMVATKASKSQIIAVIKAWPKEAKSAAGVKAFNTHCKALAKLNVKPASKQPVHVVDDENIAATLSAIASSNGQKEPSYVLTARIHLAQIKASEKTVHQIFMTNPSFFHHLLEAGNLDEQFDTIRMIATTQGLQLFQRLCPQGYSLPIDFASKNKHFDTSQKTLRFVFEKTKELADSNPDFDRNRLQISYNNAFMNSDDMFLLLDEVLEAECRAKLYNDALHSGRMVIADRLYPSLTADIVNEVIFLEDCSTTCTIASLINSGKPDIAGALIDRFSGALDLNVTLIQSVAGGATIRTLSTVALRRGYTDLATRIDAAELPQESSMQRLAFTDERIADVSISVPDYLVEYMPDISGQYSYQQLVNLQQALRDAPHLIHGLLAAPSMNQEQVLIQMKIAALLFRRELETEPEPLESARIPFEIAMQNDCLSEGPIKPYLLAETLKAVAARSSEGVAVQLLQRVVGSFEAESDLQPVVMAIREELSEEMMKFFALSNVIDDKRLWAALFTEVKKDPTRTLGKEPDVLDIVDIIAEAGRTDTMQLFLSENPNYDLNQKKLACETGAKADAVQETSLLFLEAQKGNTAMMTLFLLHGARPMTEPQYVTLSFAQKRSYIASIANTRIDELFEAVWPLHTQLPSRRQQRRNKEVLALRSEFSRIEARLKVLEKEKSAKLDMQAAAAQLSPSQKQLFKTQFKAFESKPHPWSAQDIQAYKALIKQYQSAAETLESVENTMDQIEGNKLAYEQQLAREAEQAAELQNHHRRQAALLAGAVSRMFDDRLRAQHVASARVLAHAVRVYHDARRPAQPVQVPVAVEEQRPTSTIAEDDTNATGDTHSEVAVSHEPEVENGPVQVPTVTEEKQQQPVVATAGPTVVVAEEQAITTSTAQPVMPVETGPVPVQPHLAQVQQLPPLIFSIVPSGPHDPPLMNQNALQHYQAMEQQIHALQQHAWRLEMNNSAMLGHIQAIQHSFQAKLKGFADTLSAVLGDYSLVLKNDEGKEGGKTVEQLQSFSSQSLPRLLGPVGYEPALRLTDIRTSVKTFLMGYSSRLSGTSPKDAVEKYKVGQLVQNFEELAAEQDVLNPRAY